MTFVPAGTKVNQVKMVKFGTRRINIFQPICLIKKGCRGNLVFLWQPSCGVSATLDRRALGFGSQELLDGPDQNRQINRLLQHDVCPEVINREDVATGYHHD